MKKTILVIGLVFVLILSTLILTGCGKKEETKTETENETANAVVGTWAYSTYVYTFNEDKSGIYDVSGNVMKFTYEDDGETLSIMYEGSTVPTDLKYRIDGDKLIITDSFGSDVEYTKK